MKQMEHKRPSNPSDYLSPNKAKYRGYKISASYCFFNDSTDFFFYIPNDIEKTYAIYKFDRKNGSIKEQMNTVCDWIDEMLDNECNKYFKKDIE